MKCRINSPISIYCINRPMTDGAEFVGVWWCPLRRDRYKNIMILNYLPSEYERDIKSNRAHIVTDKLDDNKEREYVRNCRSIVEHMYVRKTFILLESRTQTHLTTIIHSCIIDALLLHKSPELQAHENIQFKQTKSILMNKQTNFKQYIRSMLHFRIYYNQSTDCSDNRCRTTNHVKCSLSISKTGIQ